MPAAIAPTSTVDQLVPGNSKVANPSQLTTYAPVKRVESASRLWRSTSSCRAPAGISEGEDGVRPRRYATDTKSCFSPCPKSGYPIDDPHRHHEHIRSICTNCVRNPTPKCNTNLLGLKTLRGPPRPVVMMGTDHGMLVVVPSMCRCSRDEHAGV